MVLECSGVTPRYGTAAVRAQEGPPSIAPSPVRPLPLHLCRRSVTGVLQGCNGSVTGVLQECNGSVAGVL
jgi:hypothetical protein